MLLLNLVYEGLGMSCICRVSTYAPCFCAIYIYPIITHNSFSNNKLNSYTSIGSLWRGHMFVTRRL